FPTRRSSDLVFQNGTFTTYLIERREDVMNKLTRFIYNIFSGVNTSYLVKSYFFSIIITYLIFIGPIADIGSKGMAVYTIICGILFPFASIVWDDLTVIIMGDLVIILPWPIMLFWKALKLIFLFLFTPFIAPIGLIYIYIANGFYKTNE